MKIKTRKKYTIKEIVKKIYSHGEVCIANPFGAGMQSLYEDQVEYLVEHGFESFKKELAGFETDEEWIFFREIEDKDITCSGRTKDGKRCKNILMYRHELWDTDPEDKVKLHRKKIFCHIHKE